MSVPTCHESSCDHPAEIAVAGPYGRLNYCTEHGRQYAAVMNHLGHPVTLLPLATPTVDLR